ncbi:CgeB family protein [Phenylobacterium deserti]|uniref:Glycosyltransferase n=1 Tax=Phenylobacterium deserti TaxID=1914756 RepID=A0A328ADW0_9CAUL|nr:glycosyltransferase [Phenylobacterium deserti]RAK52821.1 glycosyltransferase [Phenylobacterium deserti]
MKLVIFGLTVSSSWGNGHATLWRGLIRALEGRGVKVVFFERDVPYYAHHRDLWTLPAGDLVLYPDWDSVRERARAEARSADVVMVTSYCPDGRQASALAAESGRQAVFYDMDTPVTLARLSAGESVDYLPVEGLSGFDLVLSYTGGEALVRLQRDLGARRALPLYGHVDPAAHRPVPADERYGCDLSYLGTYAADRQPAVNAFFAEPARLRPDKRFVLGGSGYDASFPWVDNIFFFDHVPPGEHPAFFASSKLTLNVTRRDMAQMGYCPSGRLFEAAACGTPILTDVWEGLELFFEPGREILTATSTDEALAAVDLAPGDLAAIARAARERTLDQHTSDHRAAELIDILARSPTATDLERA